MISVFAPTAGASGSLPCAILTTNNEASVSINDGLEIFRISASAAKSQFYLSFISKSLP